MWMSSLVRKALGLKDEELKAFFMRASAGRRSRVLGMGTRASPGSDLPHPIKRWTWGGMKGYTDQTDQGGSWDTLALSPSWPSRKALTLLIAGRNPGLGNAKFKYTSVPV